MRRAEQLFDIEARESGSPFVDRVWRARSVPASMFISTAASHWEIVIWRDVAGTHVTLRGPETRAAVMPIPLDAEFVGIQFRLGAFLPDLALPALVDRDLSIASATSGSLYLGGREWEIPGYDDVEALVGRLAGAGVLAADPIVGTAMQGGAMGLSPRSVERRVLRATGLSLGAIKQIERAHRATALLDTRVGIADVVAEVGYADQAHLTRSLKRFMGQTPGRMVAEAR
jgi:hypothetical protein